MCPASSPSSRWVQLIGHETFTTHVEFCEVIFLYTFLHQSHPLQPGLNKNASGLLGPLESFGS